MHKWAEEMLKCVKSKVEAIGIENFEGQNLDDLKDWTEVAKNIACFDKDYRIVEAMEKAEDEDEIMEMIERYEDYPERRYYDGYRHKNGRFSKSREEYQGEYDKAPYYRMTPEMYRDHEPEWYRDLDRKSKNVMYYTEPTANNESRYDKAKRMYTETKDMHKANTPEDKQITLKEGEKFLNVLFDELDEMLQDATPEMKNMIKTKTMARMQKIN